MASVEALGPTRAVLKRSWRGVLIGLGILIAVFGSLVVWAHRNS